MNCLSDVGCSSAPVSRRQVTRILSIFMSNLEIFELQLKLNGVPAPPSEDPATHSSAPLWTAAGRAWYDARTRRLLDEEHREELEELGEDELWMRLARLMGRVPVTADDLPLPKGNGSEGVSVTHDASSTDDAGSCRASHVDAA